MVFGIKKCHLYLYGRHFLLVTDHQPLSRVFGPKLGIPSLAAARMQRWALFLAGYLYDIIYRKSQNNATPDALSRLPMEGVSPEECEVAHSLSHVDLPVTTRTVAEATRREPVLSKALDLTLNGWPTYVNGEELKPYFSRRDKLSLEDGCLLWGCRVVIPSKLRQQLLGEIHSIHQECVV